LRDDRHRSGRKTLAQRAKSGDLEVKRQATWGMSVYRISLPSGALVQVHAVNSRRGDEAARVADWDDRVWLTFDPGAAIVLGD